MSDKCACVEVGDTCYFNRFYRTQPRRARKTHTCDECSRMINSDEIYFYTTAMTDGDIWQSKRCIDCESLRKVFFTCGVMHEAMWDDFKYHVETYDGQISSECLLQLTSRAREMAFEIIQERFDELNEINEEDEK